MAGVREMRYNFLRFICDCAAKERTPSGFSPHLDSILTLTFGGLRDSYAVKRGICVSNQRVL